MMSLTNLTNLLEMVNEAEGPSREIDARLWGLFIPCEFPDCLPNVKKEIIRRMLVGGDGDECPAYTSSIDAALDLVEMQLPGWGVEIIKPSTEQAKQEMLPSASLARPEDVWISFRSEAKTGASILACMKAERMARAWVLDAVREEVRAMWGIGVPEQKPRPVNYRREWRERLRPMCRSMLNSHGGKDEG